MRKMIIKPTQLDSPTFGKATMNLSLAKIQNYQEAR